MICLKIIDKNQNTVAVSHGEDEVNLAVFREYQKGDRIVLETNGKASHVWLQFDDALGKSMVYITGNTEYYIPFDEKRINISPKAFSGERHLLSARIARAFEISAYRNLAVNVYDQHENKTFFPHATANVETRGESVFAAQNAIDGITANHSHGEWPYESWGINRNPDAKLRLDFGRTVEVDRIIIYLRADFPHDNWWKEATVVFSDGDKKKVSLIKTDMGQEVMFERKKVEWLELCELIPSEEISPCPALTQIEVYGIDKSE